jgi:hypothetical protein
VDTLSFSDPHFPLPAPVTQARPGPNAFGALSLPVAGGGEVGDFVGLRERALGGVPEMVPPRARPRDTAGRREEVPVPGGSGDRT